MDPSAGSGVFVDKYTLNAMDVGLSSTVFHDAKLLVVARDPRDVTRFGRCGATV